MRWPWKTGLGLRSLKMSPFDKEPVTSYWHSIVTVALSRVVLKVKVSRLENVSVALYSFSIAALYWHSLDGAIICCWPHALIIIRLWRYLLTYYINTAKEWRGHSGIRLHVWFVYVVHYLESLNKFRSIRDCTPPSEPKILVTSPPVNDDILPVQARSKS